MKHTFKINGTTYTAKEFDFNTVCDLEDIGISISDMQKKPVATARAYFALCIGGDVERAGDELQQHMIDGGNLNDLVNAMVGAMNDSDFFQALTKRQEKKATTSKRQTETKSE